MRAWKMTAGLTVIAAIAALLAPRLLAQPAATVPQILPSQSTPLVVAPSNGLVEPVRGTHALPAVIPAKRPLPPTPPPPPAPVTWGIPELTVPIQPAPPVVPVEPDPRLDEVWPDMVDCGMG